MDCIKTELIEKTPLFKRYRVNKQSFGDLLFRAFYAGSTNELLNNYHKVFTLMVTDIYFKVFYHNNHLVIDYDFKEIFEHDKSEHKTTNTTSFIEYKQSWSQGIFNKTEFNICWGEVSRMIYADLDTMEYKSVYKEHVIRDYESRYGKVLDQILTEERSAVNGGIYSKALDMVISILLVPIAMPKYINYYRQRLTDGKADYTAEQLDIYEKFLLQEFSYAAALEQAECKFKTVSDYKPELRIQTFEYFVYQMKHVYNHAEDFNASKELIKRFDQLIVDLSNAQYGADIFDLKKDM